MFTYNLVESITIKVRCPYCASRREIVVIDEESASRVFKICTARENTVELTVETDCPNCNEDAEDLIIGA